MPVLFDVRTGYTCVPLWLLKSQITLKSNVKSQRRLLVEDAVSHFALLKALRPETERHHVSIARPKKCKIELALWQAEWVKAELEKRYPEMEVSLTKIKTQGDKILDVPLAMVGGKGLFVKEIEEAMLRGEFRGKSVIKITVLDEDALKFEGIEDPKAAESKEAVVHHDQ